MRVGYIIEPEPAFYAQTAFVGRTFDTVDPGDLVVLDLERQLTADAAVGANALDLAVEILAVADQVFIDGRRRHQRAGRASLNAFAAGDA